VISCLAVGALSTYIGVWLTARVLALEAHARFTGVAVCVARALRVAAGVWVTKEVLGARARSTVVTSLAVCVFSTDSLLTGSDAAIRLSVTFLRLSASLVAFALVTTPGERVADVGGFAFADGAVVFTNCAVSVGAARSADLVTGEPATVSERISCSSPGTSTDGHMIPDSAVSPLAAGDAAGINALVVLAGLLGGAI